MRTNTLITSDLHLGHEKAAIHRGFTTIEEHDEFIIQEYNKQVRPIDTCWIVGDVVFQPSKNIPMISRLNGIKHLVLGNHEHHNICRYIQYFHKIVAFCVYKEFVISHIPIHSSQLDERYHAVNLHGHIHSHEIQFMHKDNRYFNVNCELHDYHPLYFDDIRYMIELKNASTVC